MVAALSTKLFKVMCPSKRSDDIVGQALGGQEDDFSSSKVAVCYNNYNNYNNDNSYNHYRRGYGGNTFNGYQHAVAH
jgi:hypothetical protein